MMLLAGMIVLLAGCQEPFDSKTTNGLRIKVSTVSNDLSTKTVYSGETVNGFERIDWKAGDGVRIFSEDINQVANATGVKPTGGYVYAEGDAKYYHDYTIASNGTPRENEKYMSDSSLKSEGEGVGLVWVNDPTATAKVYGIYPTGTSERFSSDQIFAGFRDLTIPVDQNWAAADPNVVDGITITPIMPDMANAYMVAKPTKFKNETDNTGNKIPTVNLEFYPIFNAFEIQLQGVANNESEIALKSVTLSSSSSNLTGDYKYRYLDRNSTGGELTNWNSSKVSGLNRENGPKDSGIDYTGNNGKSVTVTFPNGTVISNKKAIKFTILTLPGKNTDSSSGSWLTDMTLTVTYANGQSKSLALNQNDSPIKFKSFHKARITGLALDGGEKWMLDIYTDVDKWTVYEKNTSFSQQIVCDQFKDPADPTKSLMVQGMWETKNHYADEAGVVNGHTGYEKYYQIRTLKDDYFIVKFRPYAPVGGYWRVRPWFISGDTASPDKFEILVFEEGDTPGQGTYSSDLTGQIMGNWVTLHIRPKNYDPQEDDGVYVMLLHCDFGTTRNFVEGTYLSADSEFQDVHGDGRYSYWRFTLDKSYTGGN